MRAMSYEENTKPEPDDADELEISHVRTYYWIVFWEVGMVT